ncbi:MAG: hypothetical protein ACYC3G_02875 [Minisyncoccota bacterium]
MKIVPVYVYLAGGMKSGWQDKVKEACYDLIIGGEVEFFDPREGKIKDPDIYVPRDIAAANESDIVFGCAEEDNPGLYALSAEMAWIKRQNGIVILVNLLKKDGDKNRYFRFVPKFCQAHETENMEEAISILRDAIHETIIHKNNR